MIINWNEVKRTLERCIQALAANDAPNCEAAKEAKRLLAETSQAKAYTFHIVVPSEMDAGIRGYYDEITVIVASGEPGGDADEFKEYVQTSLVEWFDGGKVTYEKD